MRYIQGRGNVAWPSYKNEFLAFVAEQAQLGVFRHGIPTPKWWRGFKCSHPQTCQTTPSMPDTQRAISMLTEEQWQQWFHQHLRPALMALRFNARTTFNEDASAIFMD